MSTKTSKINIFKNAIRFIVSIFASREFAFVYCIIGTLAQASHTYYLIHSISSLDGFGRILQALGLSIFISSSLLFFTAIADNDKTSPDYKRTHLAVNLFMIIEILINSYYYASHLLIKHVGENGTNIFDFIFALLVSCLIPVTIKLYAGIIQAKEWFEDTEKQDVWQTKIDEIKREINKEKTEETFSVQSESAENMLKDWQQKNDEFKNNETKKRSPIFKGIDNVPLNEM